MPDCKPAAEGGHPEFLRILDEMRELHVRKAADYGRGVDPLANCRGSVEFGVPAWVGTMIRATDKVHRVKSFILNGNLKNESVEDSLKDLAAYAILALILYREVAGTDPAGPRLAEGTGPAPTLAELEAAECAARVAWYGDDGSDVCEHANGQEVAGCRSCDLWLAFMAAEAAWQAASQAAEPK